MSSVSLAGAGVRGVAELKNGFGERASTLSHYGPVSRECLDRRTGDFRNEAGLAPAVKNFDRTPAGDYRQVTFANDVVAESQPMSHEAAQ
jgi:hypothetical protein